MTTFDEFDYNEVLYVYLHSQNVLASQKEDVLGRPQKRYRSVKIKMEMYKTDVLTYFDRKHSCANSNVTPVVFPCKDSFCEGFVG